MGVEYEKTMETTIMLTFIHVRILPVIPNKEVINYEKRQKRKVTKKKI